MLVKIKYLSIAIITFIIFLGIFSFIFSNNSITPIPIFGSNLSIDESDFVDLYIGEYKINNYEYDKDLLRVDVDFMIVNKTENEIEINDLIYVLNPDKVIREEYSYSAPLDFIMFPHEQRGHTFSYLIRMNQEFINNDELRRDCIMSNLKDIDASFEINGKKYLYNLESVKNNDQSCIDRYYPSYIEALAEEIAGEDEDIDSAYWGLFYKNENETYRRFNDKFEKTLLDRAWIKIEGENRDLSYYQKDDQKIKVYVKKTNRFNDGYSKNEVVVRIFQ